MDIVAEVEQRRVAAEEAERAGVAERRAQASFSDRLACALAGHVKRFDVTLHGRPFCTRCHRILEEAS